MSNLFPTSGQIGAETPDSPVAGNLFGENAAATQAAQQALIQRVQALQQAQLTPEQNGAFMANQAGNLLGQAAGQAIAPPQPNPLLVKLAQIKQSVDAEAQQSGITDPEQYLRLAASKLVQGGMYQQALAAQQQADSLAKSGAAPKLANAQANEANSIANKNNQETVTNSVLAPYQVVIKAAEANFTDPKSQSLLADAQKATSEAGVVKALADANIAHLRAMAAHEQTLSKGEGKQSDYELMGTLFDEKGAGTITPARQALLDSMIAIKSKPQTVVNSILGGTPNSNSFMPGATPTPANSTPGTPVAPIQVPSSNKQSASGTVLPPGIPAGSKQIGTSGGKPVYQTPQGKRLIVK